MKKKNIWLESRALIIAMMKWADGRQNAAVFCKSVNRLANRSTVDTWMDKRNANDSTSRSHPRLD